MLSHVTDLLGELVEVFSRGINGVVAAVIFLFFLFGVCVGVCVWGGVVLYALVEVGTGRALRVDRDARKPSSFSMVKNMGCREFGWKRLHLGGPC